jgi:signal-transduction protein with cAMP-binding, CBS, and nucleotidyltransferase domain
MDTGQHFQEILETLVMTTGLSKADLAANIGVSHSYTLSIWSRQGVPIIRRPHVKEILHELLFYQTDSVYGRRNLERDLKRRRGA